MVVFLIFYHREVQMDREEGEAYRTSRKEGKDWIRLGRRSEGWKGFRVRTWRVEVERERPSLMAGDDAVRRNGWKMKEVVDQRIPFQRVKSLFVAIRDCCAVNVRRRGVRVHVI